MESEERGDVYKSRLSGRKLLVVLSIVLVIFLAGYGTRYFYLKIKYPEREVIKGVPGNAIMVIEGRGMLGFFGQLLNGSLWKQGFLSADIMDHLSVLATEMESIAGAGNSEITALFTGQPFAMALVPKKQDGPEFLFLIQMNKGVRPAAIHNYLQQQWPSYQEKKLLEISYYERVLPDGSPLFVAIKDGLVIASVNREVFELAYYSLESGNDISADVSFSDLRDQISKSKNTAAKVYISYEGFFRWITRYIDSSKKPLIASMPDMGVWAALEITFEIDGAHLQGFTGSNVPCSGYTEAMSKAVAVLNDPGPALPFNTIFYNQSALSSFHDYLKLYVNGYLVTQGAGRRNYPVESNAVDSLKTILTEIGVRSLTIAATEKIDSIQGSNYLIVLESSNAEELSRSLISLSDTVLKFEYQGYEVLPLSARHLIPAVFGSNLHVFEEAWVTRHHNWIIIAPTNRALLGVLNNLTLGRTLDRIAEYSSAIANVQGEMSRRYYLDRVGGGEFLSSMVSGSKADQFNRLLPFLPRQMVLAFKKEEGVVLTDIVLRAQDEGKSGASAGGEVILDDIPLVNPLAITDHRNGEVKIVIADQSDFLYLLNSKGNLEWKLEVRERPLSELHYIDLYKNGRQQCLFFSRNMIHLVQIDGKYVSGFPVRLNQPFHSHLSVFDYENNGNYRLIYRGVNDKLFNVGLTGNPVSGWTNPAISSLSHPVKWFKTGGADFLVSRDSSGVVNFYDRRGKERFALPDTVKIGSNSEIVLTRSLGSLHFTFIDRDGYLQQVSTEGKVTKNEAMNFSQEARLLGVGASGRAGEPALLIVEPTVISLLDQDLKLLDRNSEVSVYWKQLKPFFKDPMIVASGIDINGEPRLITRSGLKILEVSGKSLEIFDFWRPGKDHQGILLMIKGKIVLIQNI